MRKSFKKVLSMTLATAMTVGLGSAMTPATTDAATMLAKNAKQYMVAPYHAYLCFQTSNYSYRDGWENVEAGIAKTSLDNKSGIYESEEKAKLDIGTEDTTNCGVAAYNWSKMYINNTGVGENPETEKITFRDMDGDGKAEEYDVPTKKAGRAIAKVADFASPDITYEGTYTVSMSNFGENAFKYDYGFRMLYVDTTIPNTITDVKFTNVSLKFDGVEVAKFDTGITRNTKDAPHSYHLVLINEYGYSNYGFSNQAVVEDKNDAAPDPVWEKAKETKTTPVMPKQSIEVTFTLTSPTLGQKPADYVAKDDSSTAASSSAILADQAASKAALSSLAVGETFADKKYSYTVTKASEVNDGSAEVAVTALTKASKKKASLSVAPTIVKDDVTYKVTSIGKKAFAGCKKLKSVTLGANVTKIEKQAFSKCTKLAKLTVKGKLTKVEKKAFAGCKKKIKVAGGNKKAKKANIKALKKSGYKKFK